MIPRGADRFGRWSMLGLSGLVWGSVVAGFTALSAQPLSISDLPAYSCREANECFQIAADGLKRWRLGGTKPSTADDLTALLRNVQTRFAESIWAKRAAIHLAFIEMEASPESAIRTFRAALKDFPMLRDYLLFWIGEAYLEQERYQEAAQAFEALVQDVSPTILRGEALFLAGQSRHRAGDCPAALHWFRQALADQAEAPLAPQAMLNLGECERELKRIEAARQAFREIWWRYPTAPEAHIARRHLSEPEMGPKWAPTLDERYKRALSWYREAEFPQTVEELLQVLQLAPTGWPRRIDAQYKLATAYARLKQYDEAEKMFRKVSQSRGRKAGLGTVWLARAYLRQGKGAKLLNLRDRLSSYRLSGDQQAMIHIFCGVWFEDHRQFDQAVAAYRQAVKAAKSTTRRLDALWRIGWRRYQQADYRQAVKAFEEMLAVPDDGDEHARAAYWIARTMERLKQQAKAVSRYGDLAQDRPFTYYGQLARLRLSPPPATFQTVSNVLRADPSEPQNPLEISSNVHYRKATELVALRMFDEAGQELWAASEDLTGDQESVQVMLRMVQRAQAYDLGIRIAIRYFGPSLRQGQVPFGSPIWEWAYPRGYVPTIQTYASSALDPFLVAGLIREESLYDTSAVSRVGALGLMQLMPKTARVVAQRLGLAVPEREDLFEAEANIQLGTVYINELLHTFQGNLVYAVAAYNAGPDAVSRWVGRDGSQEADEFVESIPYRETRGYVKRVLGSYWIYRALAGRGCQSRSLDTMC